MVKYRRVHGPVSMDGLSGQDGPVLWKVCVGTRVLDVKIIIMSITLQLMCCSSEKLPILDG